MGLRAVGRRLLAGGVLAAGKRPGEGGAARQRADGGVAGPRVAFVWRGACGWEAARRRQGSWQYGVPVQTAGGWAQKERRRGGGRRPSGPAIAAEGSGEPVGVGGASARCLPGGEPQLLPYRQRGAPGGGRTGPFSRCGCGEKRSPSPNRQNPGVCCRKMQHFRVFHRKNTENLQFIHKWRGDRFFRRGPEGSRRGAIRPQRTPRLPQGNRRRRTGPSAAGRAAAGTGGRGRPRRR